MCTKFLKKQNYIQKYENVFFFEIQQIHKSQTVRKTLKISFNMKKQIVCCKLNYEMRLLVVCKRILLRLN